MRKANSLVALLAVVVLVSGWVHLASGAEMTRVSPALDRILAKKELVVGTAADMPPLNMTTKEGQIIGVEADLAFLFSSGMNVKLTLKPIPFNDLLPALEAGQVDMILSGMTITTPRNLRVAFAGPYFASGKSVLVKDTNVDSLDELSKINNPDKTLVALKGSTSQLFAERFVPKAKLLLTDNYDQAVAMVRDDRALAMVADFPFCLISAFRYREEKLVTLKKPLSYEPIGIALPANDPLLVNLVQNFLNTLEKSGDLEMIVKRWFMDTSWVDRLR
jgi:polar amino acid transport system substrate-binding protein